MRNQDPFQYPEEEFEDYEMCNPEFCPEILPLDIYESPRIEDVVGVSRKFIDDFILFQENEMVFSSMGVQPDKTFLLTGKPGKGKTMAISAINNSLNKEIFNFMENFRKGKTNPQKINFEEKVASRLVVLPYEVGKYGTAYINQGSKNIEKFFNRAYSFAEEIGRVLISIDEADAILTDRNQGFSGHNEDKKVLETLMKNL
jgi:SpoVK/Ycf46/Vps4 family AAA+-type ATPase